MSESLASVELPPLPPPPIDYGRACIQDIQRHIETVGAHDWQEVQARHPEIKERRFWRMVKKIKEGRPNHTPSPQAIKASITMLENGARKEAVSRNIPRAPSPSVIAAGGIEGRRKLDFVRHIDQMLADCDALRRWSIRVEPDGTEVIHNPMYFSQQIKLRQNILDTGITAMRALWDLQKMQEFYDVIISEVSKLAPEAGKAIMERLQQLDDERGMTMNARIA